MPATASSSTWIWSRCRRHSIAWWPVNRPVSAIDRPASFPADRIRPIARSASTWPRRSPSIIRFCHDSPARWNSKRGRAGLLDTALLQGLGDNLGAARGSRAQEIGRIVHTDCELPPVSHHQAGADAGGGFDGGGVDTAVHHAPWRVVIWPEVDVPDHAGSACESTTGLAGNQSAGGLSAEIVVGARAGLGIGRVVHGIGVAEDDYFSGLLT